MNLNNLKGVFIMKNKFLAILAASVCAAAMLPTASYAADSTGSFDVSLIKKYDFNLDGMFTSADANILLEYYSHNQSGSSFNYSDNVISYIEKNADVNGDGKINSSDSAQVLSALKLRYDFNLDGTLDIRDCNAILTYYTEKQDGSLSTAKSKLPANVTAYIQSAGNVYVSSDETASDINSVDATFILNDCKSAFYFSSGDVDGNNTVDAVDASIILSYYSAVQLNSLSVDSAEYQKAITFGDINSDGTIDARDASAISDMYTKNMSL